MARAFVVGSGLGRVVVGPVRGCVVVGPGRGRAGSRPVRGRVGSWSGSGKFCHTTLAKLMAIVVDPCSAEFDAKEKNKLESISHESLLP